MMLMTMRLQKPQVKSLYRYEGAQITSFKGRDPAIMAGYTQMDSIMVGAAGGYGGSAYGATFAEGLIMYGGGPGGGGMVRLHDDLKNLLTSEPIAIGPPGSGGVSTSGNNTATNGGNGGNAVFHNYIAYGGEGGSGSDWVPTGGGHGYNNGGYGGGNGGANSANLGSGGLGAPPSSWYFGPGDGDPSILTGGSPTTGNAVAGSDIVVAAGKGGGGGRGLLYAKLANPPANSGAGGNLGGYYSEGGAPVTNHGGAGGGADLVDFTGVHEFWGSARAGSQLSGIVVIKLS